MDNICIQIQSSYSMLNSTIVFDKLMEQAKQLNYSHLALCDINNLHGAMKFYRACKSNKITPIIGLNATIESEKFDHANIILYAKNNIGYQNLLIISSAIYLSDNGMIQINELKKYLKDIIVVTPGMQGEIERTIYQNESYTDVIRQYSELFEDFYFGVTGSEPIYMDEVFPKIQLLSKDFGIKCVMLDTVKYLEQKDIMAYDVLNAIETGIKIDYKNYHNEGKLYLKNTDELNQIYKDIDGIIDETKKVFQSIEYQFEFDNYRIPKFPIEENSDVYLTKLCETRLEELVKNKRDMITYKKRLFEELHIIQKMGFSDYFLIVEDFVNYAKNKGILVGPGRGSAAGSLVAYSLGITEVDPMKYNLFFERFLNPERITMPDIDLDFPDDKRDTVIQYVLEKYGKSKVANIVAFGTFAARSALRDVSKVLEIEDMRLNRVLEFVPTNGSDIGRIVEKNDALQRLLEQNQDLAILVSLAIQIEGLPRHTTTHAAGIIINDENIVQYCPLQKGLNGLYQTQFEAKDLEMIGLLKIDFLGLRNLKTIQDIIDEAEEKFKKKINIMDIPLDDKATYEILKKGDTNGIFQLESSGMRNLLRQLETSNFNDIVAALALYRPGPMENIPAFIKRKKGLEKVEYPHKDLKNILEDTYGIIVYQEQIMQIANQFAGYSLAEADILRRAISKKDRKTMDKERNKFVSNCITRGYNKIVANNIYDYIVKFADYGFNKSHSVSYALISYQLAYLKANYPSLFMKSLLTSVIGSEGQINKYIKSIFNSGGSVLIPSVNFSDNIFMVEDEGLRFPLLSIKNVGRVASVKILEEREKNGQFKSFENFISRMNKQISSRVIEALIYAGALDEYHITKKGMIDKINDVIDLYDLGGFIDKRQFAIDYPKEEFDYDILSSKEREHLGINLKYHPLLKYEQFIKKHHLVKVSDIDEKMVGDTVKLLAVLSQVREIKTKESKKMAFIVLEDNISTIEGIMFPNVYEESKKMLHKGDILYLLGKIELRNKKTQITIERVSKLK